MQSSYRALALVAALAAAFGAAPGSLSAQSAPVQLVPVHVTAEQGLKLAPFKRGDRIFNVDAAGSLYVRGGKDARPRRLLAGGTYGALTTSTDGKYVAYTVPMAHDTSATSPSSAGADVRVRTVDTGRDLPDVLHNAIISPKAWTHNERGFFYTREDPTDHRQRVYYHGLGKDQSRDAIMLTEFDQPDWRYDATVSDDGQFAVFTITHPLDAHTRMYFLDMDNPGRPTLNAPVVKLIDAFSARYEFIDNAGSYFFLQTNRDAPRGSVVLANTDVTRVSSWPIIIPQETDTLLYVRTAGEQYVLPVYHSGNTNVARVYGPPDAAVMRAEFQKRIDSLTKDRTDAARSGRHNQNVDEKVRMRAPAAIRLSLENDFPLPTGATLLAMNTVADDDELFYTVRMPDGSTRSFMYNIDHRRSEPFPPGPQAH